MANKPKRGTKEKQTFIPGTEPPPLPEAVEKFRDEYLEAQREKNNWLAKLRTKRDELIAAMREHEIPRLLIDDGKNWLELDDKFVLRTVPRKEEANA